ncbi:MAG: hypothetical protein NTX52_04710 [Planctomycetota bacterium]|nr:hypothetical protein [Planctomycetota bacterium]
MQNIGKQCCDSERRQGESVPMGVLVWLAKRGIVCYIKEDLNRLPEDVGEWSVPSRFGGCKRPKYKIRNEKLE